MNLLRILQGAAQPEVDLKRTYDAIVIGSGAAGGMAAHVLTSQGMKVLLLEAGKKLDIDKELKSMEWPYEHPRRGDMPPGHHALSLNEYTIRQPPTPPIRSTRRCIPTCKAGAARTTRRTSSSTRRSIRTPARTTRGCVRGVSAARRTSGAGWRCGCPTTISRQRATTATVKTGRFPTRTSSRTTTGSIGTSAFPASRKTFRICRTASFSARPG